MTQRLPKQHQSNFFSVPLLMIQVYRDSRLCKPLREHVLQRSKGAIGRFLIENDESVCNNRAAMFPDQEHAGVSDV